MSDAAKDEKALPDLFRMPFAFAEYWIDTVQRSILYLDTMRQRGNNFLERAHQIAPHVLTFEPRLLVDGRTLERPCNYGLVEIVPPEGLAIDPTARPFIIVDPRAGHGPGIGGMKADSEIGVAMRAGHPCYFIGFTPEPVPGQTLEDVCMAEGYFLETVIARHPEADGKPVLIGNCQAGWQLMMTAAYRPDLAGPIMLAGSPLSYWAGRRGETPMRYAGGLLGGTWLTALSSDLGNGVFDGAHLVANFESMNPANTYWTKPYNLYSHVDTEAERFLDFEKWWGAPVMLNGGEIQSIVDNLFVGNKLARGDIRASDGTRIDLRNIQSPIIVFCSWGDDITPPPQALQWILDLYNTDMDVALAGQTIVYCLHQSIGHLGIFVSGKVASKEHDEFARAMDLIDILPPGIYEAVIEDLPEDIANRDMVTGEHLFSIQHRTLDDIRAICQPLAEDEKRFEAAARLSEVNLALYNATLRPFVRLMTTDASASMLRQLHPNRMRFALFSDRNPMMAAIPALAAAVRANRLPAAKDNPFVKAEHEGARAIETTLQNYSQARDRLKEAAFLDLYGLPIVQAMGGVSTAMDGKEPPAERDVLREELNRRQAQDALSRIGEGGPVAAAARALVYVYRTAQGGDERSFATLITMLKSAPELSSLGVTGFKRMVREQQMIMRNDPERALALIPQMLGDDPAVRRRIAEGLTRIVQAGDALKPDAQAAFDQMMALIMPPAAAKLASVEGVPVMAPPAIAAAPEPAPPPAASPADAGRTGAKPPRRTGTTGKAG